MKAMKRLKQSLAAIEEQKKFIPLERWLLGQPRSTQRGVARGRFQLPSYVR
jgi:hypothetical protein